MIASAARSLPPSAQEAIRKRAVEAYLQGGIIQAEAVARFGVSRMSVLKWRSSTFLATAPS